VLLIKFILKLLFYIYIYMCYGRYLQVELDHVQWCLMGMLKATFNK